MSCASYVPHARARLTSPFTFGGPAVFFGRARLYADCVELSGWQWRGRYRRRIPLDHILQVDVPSEDELLLWLINGRTIRLGIGRALEWKEFLQERPATDATQKPRSRWPPSIFLII